MKHCHEFEEMLRVKLSNKLISLLIFPLFLLLEYSLSPIIFIYHFQKKALP